MTDTAQNSAAVAQIYREEICEELNIKKDTYYKWTSYLKICGRRDSQKRVYLNLEQVNLLRELADHVRNTGSMAGFHSHENPSQPPAGSLSVREPKQEELALTSELEIEFEEPTNQLDVDKLVRSAAELKARNLAMPHLVKLTLAQQMTEDDLPADLKEKVADVREAANPKQSAATLAADILSQYRSRRTA